MQVLALDVDGVLLDPERGGAGHWTIELERRYDISRDDLRRTFFAPAWTDVVTGRRPIEPPLAEALATMGSPVTADEVLGCWFEADFAPIPPAIELATRAAAAGIRVVLATNQEHRRAAYLRDRLGQMFDVDDMVYSAQLGIQKRHALFFEHAAKRLGLTTSPAEVLLVDDTRANVTQARLAGWRAKEARADLAWIDPVAAQLGLDRSG